VIWHGLKFYNEAFLTAMSQKHESATEITGILYKSMQQNCMRSKVRWIYSER